MISSIIINNGTPSGEPGARNGSMDLDAASGEPGSQIEPVGLDAAQPSTNPLAQLECAGMDPSAPVI